MGMAQGRATLQYRGWHTSPSYMGDRMRGYSYFTRLIDEMAENDCNYIQMDMGESGIVGEAEGCAWPISDPDLREFLDPLCPNSYAESEYLPEVIQYAHQKGIRVDLFFKPHHCAVFLLNQHPDWKMVTRKGQRATYGVPCIDNPTFRDISYRLFQDLIKRYADPSLGKKCADGLTTEGPTYGPTTCYCPYCQGTFRQMYGKSLDFGRNAEIREWKFKRLGAYYKGMLDGIKKINPNLETALHSWDYSFETDSGHDVREEVKAGFTFSFPGHHELQKHLLFARLDHLTPYLPCMVHLNARRLPPGQYGVPSVVPEDIPMQMEWVREYKESRKDGRGDRVIGAVYIGECGDMHPGSRQAVYQALRGTGGSGAVHLSQWERSA